MFYLIETQAQLAQFATYDLTTCFIEVIPGNDHYHPSLTDVSLVYIKPTRSRMGFILSVNHTESFSLPAEEIWKLINDKVSKILVKDGKRAMYYPLSKEKLICLKTAAYLNETEYPKDASYDTAAHNFFYSKYPYNPGINAIIPISKHYEKYELFFRNVNYDQKLTESKYFKFYNNMGNRVFYEIEKTGLTVDKVSFSDNHKLKHADYSLYNDKIYTWYNLFTQTGRPSNTFNGLNFSGLPKHDNSREFIIPTNDCLVEFDYVSYHPNILCEWVDYSFEDSDIHNHLGKQYFNKSVLTDEEYTKSKNITFRTLYTGVKKFDNLFFDKVDVLKAKYWKQYIKEGKIPAIISGRPLSNIQNDVQLLPYLLQNYETERNILILNELFSFLENKKSTIVLYNYDSLLIDFSKEDGKETLNIIQQILEQDGYLTTCKMGKNYKELQ